MVLVRSLLAQGPDFYIMNFIILISIPRKPKPYKIPVINRLVLVDLYLVMRCIPPSTAIGTHINASHTILKSRNGIIQMANIYPMIIPVHRAHTGN